MVRILPKQELVSLKQREQEVQVKQAVKLSTQVDELQQLRLAEEKKLREFREREFARFSREKEEKEGEISSLSRQIEDKKLALAEYFEKNPIDKQWLLFVNTEKANIESKQRALTVKETDLFLLTQELETKREELTKKEILLQGEKVEILRIKEQADSDKIEAEAILLSANTEARNITYRTEEMLMNAKAYEEDVKLKAQNIESFKLTLDDRERALEEREGKALALELKYYSPVRKL